MRLTVSGSRRAITNQIFSTTLYAGNSGTQSIVSGVDLVNNSGLIWLKARNDNTTHVLTDTDQGVGNILSSDSNAATAADADTVTDFNTNGFSLGDDAKTNGAYNYTSWTFREATKFFDVSALTKTAGSDATITFPKLETLGMVMVKRTNFTSDWDVWHRGLTAGDLMKLNTAGAEQTRGTVTVSGTTVTLVDGVILNGSYMVYAFAHDSHLSGKIQCGTYTGNGSTTGPEVDLGWRPQFLIGKAFSGGTSSWITYDNKRSPTNPRTALLSLNTAGAESTGGDVDFTATGFQLKEETPINRSGDGYIYLAIREEQ